jgi:hypothetical protein
VPDRLVFYGHGGEWANDHQARIEAEYRRQMPTGRIKSYLTTVSRARQPQRLFFHARVHLYLDTNE